MKVYTGIWMDKKGATIIHLSGESVDLLKIKSNIETLKMGGGSRSKVPYGPMEKTSESKLLQRKKHQQNKYFADISEQIRQSDKFFIMGPAESKTHFNTYWQGKNKNDDRLIDVQTVDSISENQKIQRVKNVFAHLLN